MSPSFAVVECNLRSAMKLYARATPEGKTSELPGLSVVSSGLAVGVFNAALLTIPTNGDLERRIELAGTYFRAVGLPWSFWVCEDLLDARARRDHAKIFLRRGFRVATEPVGMSAFALQSPRRLLQPLEIRPVNDANSRLAFCEISAAVFDLPFSTAREIYDQPPLWRDGFRGYLGYQQGRAVSTAALLADGSSIGVYSVATLHRFQRRGCAESLLRTALAHTMDETGPLPLVLQSTRAGRSLYEHLGFAAVTRFVVYLLE